MAALNRDSRSVVEILGGIRSAPRIQSPLKLGTTFIITHRILHLNWDKTYYFFTVDCRHPAYMTL